MNAEELRIGNLIKAPILINGKTVIQEVVSIGVKYAQLKNLPDGFAEHIKYDEIEPIPLTEEWLLKMGFEKVADNCWMISNDGVATYIDLFHGAFQYYLDYEMDASVILNSVHELQNLIYALTKEELKFEL